MMVEAPEGKFTAIDVTVEQAGKTFPVFTLDQPQGDIRQESAERLYVMRPVGKRALPDLQSGPARIVVKASRPVLFGLRNVSSTTTHDVTVRLEPPQVAVLSTFHYINHGGSEFVVYRATPADVESGVRVGNIEYPGFPASAVGITSDPGSARRVLRACSSIRTSTRTSRSSLATLLGTRRSPHSIIRCSPSRTRRAASRSTIASSAASCRPSPGNSPQEKIPTDDLLSGFLKINGDLRRKNNQYLTDLAKKSAPEMLFKGPFQQLGNSQVEARFADTRTYVYKGKEDRSAGASRLRSGRHRQRPGCRRGARDGRPCF